MDRNEIASNVEILNSVIAKSDISKPIFGKLPDDTECYKITGRYRNRKFVFFTIISKNLIEDSSIPFNELIKPSAVDNVEQLLKQEA